jgi:hypothetical protein
MILLFGSSMTMLSPPVGPSKVPPLYSPIKTHFLVFFISEIRSAELEKQSPFIKTYNLP